MQQKKIYCRASSKKNWDGRSMPPLQNDKKIRQANQIPFILPAIGIVLPEKQDMIDNPMDFHVEIVKKIDTLLKEHEKKIILEELVSAQQPTLFPEEPSVEIRSPLSKKAKAPMFQLEKKQETSFYKKLTMPDEFKTEFLMIHNPSFKFVSPLHAPEDVLRIKNPEDKHVEVIDLGSLATGDASVQKQSAIHLHKNQTKEKRTEDASEFKKDTKTFQSKKGEASDTKKIDSKKCEDVFATAMHQSKEDQDKSKIYYLTSRNLDEKKLKEREKKQSYIPVDFEDKIQKLKEKDQAELEKHKLEEQKKREKEQREREKEEKRLKKLETKKAKLEEKQKKKEEKKMLLEKLKKEAEEKKLLKKEAKKVEDESFEQLESKKEEKKRKKLEARQVRLEAKQKKKEEREALIKTLEKEAEEKKQLKKKEKHMESEEVKADALSCPVETKQKPTFVDDDVIKVLLMTDDLLGNLPEKVIDKFAQSEDFKLYEKVLSKYKTK